jgi:glycine dehydrogenase subunit 1
MEVANASMYDGATALTEAGMMACNHTRRKKLLVSRTVHPAWRQVLQTYCLSQGIAVVELPMSGGTTDPAAAEKLLGQDCAGVLVQHPNFLGCLEPVEELALAAHRQGALLAVSADPISLAILKSPGECGADIASGEGQPLGIPMGLGGPYLGLLAAKGALIRLMPGRIVGLTTDAAGREGLVLTMQAREQHIRREKATSNICSNQALCALAATVYLSLMGRDGLRRAAELCLQKSHYLAEKLKPAFPAPFFKEFVHRPKEAPGRILEKLKARGILGGIDLAKYYPELSGHLLIAVTEKRTREELDQLATLLSQ